jgi:hypothetical protein
VRRDAAVGQASHRGLGQPAPLRVVHRAERLVDAAEVLLELAHRGKGRRAAGIGPDARDRRVIGLRADVVEHQAADAPAQCTGRGLQPDRTTHRGAEPVQLLEPELIGQRCGEPGIEVQAVLLLGDGAPLAQAAAEGVGADHAPALRQVRGDVVHVAPGARQAMPGDHRLGLRCAPFGVVQLAAQAGDVVGGEAHDRFRNAPSRSRPTTPAGKW